MTLLNYEELIEHFLKGGDDPTGELGYELLQRFHEGLEVQHLVPLLRSEFHSTARLGAWIASELGSRPRVLLSELVALVDHESPRVRFSIVGCLLNCIHDEDWPIALRVANLGVDKNEAVRWQVMSFFTYIAADRAASIAKHARGAGLDGSAIDGFELLSLTYEKGQELARRWLEAGTPIQQAFSASFAARWLPESKPLLKSATRSFTRAVRNFATDMLARRHS